MIVVVIACLGCSYQIYFFMKLYLEYPIVENLQVEERNTVHFPAVTICNLNRMKLDWEPALDCSICFENNYDKDEYSAGNPLILSERRSISSQNKNESKAQQNFLKNYFKLSPEDRKNFGYLLDEVVESCSFNFKSCEFQHNLNMRYGNCYTFNRLNGIFKDAQMVNFAGSIKALEMTLSIKPEQYLSTSHTVGMRILIHEPSDEPNPEYNGFNIIPGYETHISLKQTEVQRLPAPYKDKCVLYGGVEKPLVKSQTHCMQACIQEYNFAKCGCIEPDFWSAAKYNVCDIKNSTDVDCLNSLINELSMQGTNCKCPPPCFAKHYNEQITRALWPSKAYYLQNRGKIYKNSYKTYRKSHARVRIFFSTLEKSTFEQKAMFQEPEMFSCLGGEFGLWLGLSLFVFCELIDILLFLVGHLLRDFKKCSDFLCIII
ncbi:Degenerin mec-10, partial [Araneus ventricosus]